ncbi:MAG: magnesium-translocating P-type ATPase [Chthoniobacterales bacterium]|nr:magnesium-translocating P-type ATPase [Chthoniobacterales bacterium]
MLPQDSAGPTRDELTAASAEAMFQRLGASNAGLKGEEARERLSRFGANELKATSSAAVFTLLIGQFKSPIIIILIGAAILAAFLQDAGDAVIILVIVLASGLLGFWQEHGAAGAVAKLRAVVETKTRALRDGVECLVPLAEIVPGDVVLLAAGGIVPGDCRLLTARDLFVNEATLTGETFPVEKSPGVLGPNAALAQCTNALFMGTNVVSGNGQALVVHTGRETEFGKVFESLKLRPPETEFEQGIRRFGYLLAEVTLVLVLGIFAGNVYFHKPVLDSFLFALALAVGLTPQLLPAIISINLSRGARRMAEKKVITKRLAAIENFGSMDVLCSDKTGTITEGKVKLYAALDAQGKESAKVSLYAYLNAKNETGIGNPINEAICESVSPDCGDWHKVDELPYDFARKRMSILFEEDGRHTLITKGALRQMLEICSQAERADGSLTTIDATRAEIDRQWHQFSNEGHRVLGVAYRDFGNETHITRESENGLTFLGFIVLADPPKAGIDKTIHELSDLGISLKIITGDNVLIATHVAQQIGLDCAQILSGPEMIQMSTQALMVRANEVHVFAEVEPNQKERIILALKKSGHVVGYMGDGINDATALHAADVGISVESAVDVAREAADFVLLERDLGVLVEGVREGRRTFANTLKYVFIATSANFGNMFSMAGASLFLPFLPLLPKQILFINLLTDLPEMTIAGDNVDPESVQAPRRWDIGFIRRFMIVFGIVSSVFDCLTFAVLLWLHATVAQFRTGWFMESIISASLIVLVVRSRRPFFKSRPSKMLVLATAGIVVLTAFTPYLPFAGLLGFEPMPTRFYPTIALIVLSYVAAAEITKRFFYRSSSLAPAIPARLQALPQ